MTLALHEPVPAPPTLTKPAQTAADGVTTAAPVREFARLDVLPAGYDRLFARAGQANVCLTRRWFDILAHHEQGAGGQLRLLGLESDAPSGAALALLIGRHREHDRLAFGGRSYTGLDNFYTLLYAPLMAPGADIAPLAAHLCRARPAYDLIRLQALDPHAPTFPALQDAFARAGFAVQTYRHFGNWYEPTAGLAYADYLAARPGPLRTTIARKTRRLKRLGRLELEIVRGAARLDAAWADYEAVCAKGWKQREAQPALLRDFAGLLADSGALRLALLRLDGVAIAAQLWFVWDGTATVYKLAHDQQLDAHSPGTVLTARVIERLLDGERVRALDFGPGDDPWKRAWASCDRARWGILAFNRRTVRGRLAIARHIWGRKVKRAVVGKIPPQIVSIKTTH